MWKGFSVTGLAIAGVLGLSVTGACAQTAGDWTGFYAGGAAGYGFFDANDRTSGGGPEPDGFTGTGFAGVNYQMGQMLLGVEADISAGSLKKARDWLTPLEIDYVGTIRGRVGFAMGDILLYATGGLAYSRMTATHWIPAGSAREMFTGWTAGAGLDWHAGRNWFIRMEYLYTDLGSEGFDFRGVGHSHNVSVDGSMVRIGVGFLF